MSEFTGALILQDNLDGNTWTVFKSFRYYFDKPEKKGWYIDVNSGFVTDLASKPLVRKTGKYNRPAVLHDHNYKYPVAYFEGSLPENFDFTICYCEKWLTRLECDNIFFISMRISGVNIFSASFYWLMVRLFGWKAWNRHRSRDEDLSGI